jgi:hypothetical protein
MRNLQNWQEEKQSSIPSTQYSVVVATYGSGLFCANADPSIRLRIRSGLLGMTFVNGSVIEIEVILPVC